MRRLLWTLILIAACDNLPTDPALNPSFLVVSGDGQSGVVGRSLANPLVVKAVDARGRPQKNVQVSFVITSGGGSATPSSAKTDQNGLAQTSWTLGTSIAQAQRLEARAGSTVLGSFTATALAGPPAQITIQAGSNQSAIHDAAVAVAPAVRVADQYANPVVGASVSFTILSGGGSVTGSPALSASDGVASVTSWRLGSSVGVNTLQASVSGASPVTFTATATPGPAARLILHAGDNQTAVANTYVPVRPAVRVADDAGNNVTGTLVRFTPLVGGNFVYPDTARSGADGIASPSFWMLGPKAGPNTMRATAVGLSDTIIYHATAVAGPVDPDRSGISAVPDKITTSTSSRIYVIARDAILNPVPGATVSFEATGDGNTIIQPVAPTDSSGYAEGQLRSSVLGQKIVGAVVNGVRITPTWTVTVQGGPPSQLAVSAGNNQTTPVNTNVPTPPALLVRDANGNPVPDAFVTFLITQGGGTVGGSWVEQVASGQDGIASTSSWRLGTSVGINKIRATVQGLSDSLFFTATATAGAPASIAIRAGDNQVGYTSTAVPVAPSVIVKDGFNNLVPGAAVTFAITEGNGSITPPNPATTNAAGIATVGGWVLGPAIGTNRMTAMVAGANPVTFTATTRTGPAASIDVYEGNNQTGQPNQFLPIEPAVIVRDAGGNPVEGVKVTWLPTSGGGSIFGPWPFTNANGVAFGPWILGPNQGIQTLTATAEGGDIAGNPVTFTATAVGEFWKRLASMTRPRLYLTGAEAGGLFYALGGYNNYDANEAYDPATDSWQTRAPIPTPLGGMAAASVNGIVYVVGGENGREFSSLVRAYDPATNSWSFKAPMPTPRSDHAMAEVNGILYVIGGQSTMICDSTYFYVCDYNLVTSVEAYDPATDTWSTRADIPTPRLAHAVGVIDGSIYAVGGQRPGVNSWLQSVEAYDPATNTWTTKADMPTGRFSHGVGVIDGILYAVGGEIPNAGTAVNEAYNPATNSWATRVPMLQARRAFATAVIGGRLFAAGGNGSQLILDAYQPQ